MDTADSVTERDRWFVGSLLTVVATGAETDGRLSVMEQRARCGFSPPRHVHRREDTALFVIDGVITVEVGGEERVVDAGGFVWLPRDVPHTFRVDSDQARFLELVTPPGFEQYHIDASDQALQRLIPPDTEPDIARLIGAIGPYGAEIIGPPLGTELTAAELSETPCLAQPSRPWATSQSRSLHMTTVVESDSPSKLPSLRAALRTVGDCELRLS